MLPNDVLQICRLCLVKEHVDVNIFENNSKQLFYKIAACLPISIAVDDKLPKKVCLSCFNKVNLLYDFWNQTLDAEKHLLAWINENATCSTDNSQENTHQGKAQLHNMNSFDYNKYDKNINHRRDRFMTDVRLTEFLVQTQDESDDNQTGDDNIDGKGDSTENEDGYKCSDIKEEQSCDSMKSNAKYEGSKPGPSGFQDSSSTLKQLQGLHETVDVVAKKMLWFNEEKQRYEIAHNSVSSDSEEALKEKAARLQTIKIKLRKRIPSKVIANDYVLKPAANNVNGKRKKKKFKIKPDPDEKEEFKCKHCDEKFETTLLRSKHEKTAHGKHEVRYDCDKCNYSTYTKGCFTTHLKRHIKQYNLFCEECNLGFFNNTELTSHNIKSHDMQPFQCAICNDLFTSKGNLYSHIKSHDPNNSYVCEVCGRTYKKKNSYKRHIARSHLGLTTKAQCLICEKILSSKEHLRRHMLTHTDERNWVCSTCGKCFLSKTYLTEHSRIHLGIRPYKCEICGKCFTQRGSLTIHKRSHTGERPFRCEYCNKGFVMSTLLRYHLRKCGEAKLGTHFFSQDESNPVQESRQITYAEPELEVASVILPDRLENISPITATNQPEIQAVMISTELPSNFSSKDCSRSEPISVTATQEMDPLGSCTILPNSD